MACDLKPTVCQLCGEFVDCTREVSFDLECLSCGRVPSGLSICPAGYGKAVLPLCKGKVVAAHAVQQRNSEAKKAKKTAAHLAAATLPLASRSQQHVPAAQLTPARTQQHLPQQQAPKQQAPRRPRPSSSTLAGSHPAAHHLPTSDGTAPAAIPGADYVTRRVHAHAAGRDQQGPAAPAAQLPLAERCALPQVGSAASLPSQPAPPLRPPLRPLEVANRQTAAPQQPCATASTADLPPAAAPTQTTSAAALRRPPAELYPSATASPALGSGATQQAPGQASAPAAPQLPRSDLAPSVWVTDLARYNQLLLGLSGTSDGGGAQGMHGSGTETGGTASADLAMPPLARSSCAAGSERDGADEDEDGTAALLALCLAA